MHHYSKMLMASVPRLDRKWEKMDIDLKGEHSKSPMGCAYYARCQLASKDESCIRSNPPLVEVEPDHFVACIKL